MVGSGILDQAVATHRYMPDDALLASEFYADFLGAETNTFYALGGVMTDGGRGVGSIGLMRPRSTGPFDARDEKLLTEILLHLRQVLGLRTILPRQFFLSIAGTGVLDSTDLPVLLMDARRYLVHANRPGAAMLDNGWDGLVLLNGRVSALTPATERRLEHAILTAVAGRTPAAVELPARGDGEALLFVSGLPGQAYGSAPARLVLAYLLPKRDRRDDVLSTLIERFGLTATEATAAVALSEGATLQGYAEATGLSRNTVRNHVQACFAKLGVHRQADLVRMVMEVRR